MNERTSSALQSYFFRTRRHLQPDKYNYIGQKRRSLLWTLASTGAAPVSK